MDPETGLGFLEFFGKYGFFGMIAVAVVVILIWKLLSLKKETTLAKILFLSAGTIDPARNFAAVPNLNTWNAERKNVGFPPKVKEYAEVEIRQKGKLKTIRLYPSRALPAEQLKGIGKPGDFIRITYRGNKLISFVRME